jgi:uncharacterized damage-inducible protein DinB
LIAGALQVQTSTDVQTEIDRIVDELQREHEGDPWHGSPLRELLAGVSCEVAAARPIRHVHSVWEIVLHMTSWKNEVRRRLSGAPAGTPEEGDWPGVPSPTPDAWQAAVASLEQAHRSLVATIKQLPESKLFEPTNDPRDRETGAGVSHYVLLHGIVQHDVYHSGQIAIVRKAAAELIR